MILSMGQGTWLPQDDPRLALGSLLAVSVWLVLLEGTSVVRVRGVSLN